MKQELKDLLEAMKPGAKFIRNTLLSNIVTDEDDDPINPIRYKFLESEGEQLQDLKDVLNIVGFTYDEVDNIVYTDNMTNYYIDAIYDIMSNIIDSNLE